MPTGGLESDQGLGGQPAQEQCVGRRESKPTGGLERDLGLLVSLL